MSRTTHRDVTPFPNGSRTPGEGPAFSGRRDLNSIPPALQSLPPFPKGTLCEDDGSHSAFFAIDRADMSPEATLVAQLLWTVRDFIRSQGAQPINKPLQDWTIEEIVDFARGPQ